MSRRLKEPQKTLVKNFASVTGCSEESALARLKIHSWNLERAINFHFEHASAEPDHDPFNVESFNAFFEKYRCPDYVDGMDADGFYRICVDMGIEPLDPVVLVFAAKCGALTMGRFSKDEFKRGCQALKVDSLDGLKATIPAMREILNDPETCKPIYSFTFKFAVEPPAKNLPVEDACAYWKLLLKPHLATLDDWIEFVETHCRHTISRDTWMMLWDLAVRVQPDLSDFDTNGAWPVLIDEFVDWRNARVKAQRLEDSAT